MPTESAFPVVAHAIQLAVAPVFLLSGIAGLLAVCTTRLSRVVDRARALEAAWPTMPPDLRIEARQEVDGLEARRRHASHAITFSTAAALMVCVTIVLLFAEEFFAVNLRFAGGGFFVLAMFALIGGLFSFLREVYIASDTLRIDAQRFSE